MEKTDLTQEIKRYALEIGFDKVGIAKAGQLPASNLKEWLHRNYHGRMAYMENHFNERVDPTQLVDGAKSIISVAKNYYASFQSETDPSKGRISRYAWGDDYHEVLRPKLKRLLEKIQQIAPGTEGRAFVDTAPIMDKMWAVQGGIGWQGKHSNIITRDLGSWIFLGELVIDLELEYDSPIPDYCGTCSKCIDACPTGAIVEPYIVDSNRCISYLTIELKPEYDFPEELKPSMGNLIFGCDICQDVCPWNSKFAQSTLEPCFQPRKQNINSDLVELYNLTQENFRYRFAKSPVKRAKHAGLLRNVKVALANS